MHRLEDLGIAGSSQHLHRDFGCYTNEFNNYVQEIVEKDPNFDLIHWWEGKMEKYPNLFKLFLEYSFIPATSSTCESEFSYTGLVINDRRSQIKPKNVNDLMVARNDCVDLST